MALTTKVVVLLLTCVVGCVLGTGNSTVSSTMQPSNTVSGTMQPSIAMAQSTSTVNGASIPSAVAASASPSSASAYSKANGGGQSVSASMSPDASSMNRTGSTSATVPITVATTPQGGANFLAPSLILLAIPSVIFNFV